ncbi:hypothetical protein LSAT2_022390 [Lamellibrachia satsuma]|nr:hypothetical protein LSAT2_022390 [Lamellibrachia satsuma]
MRQKCDCNNTNAPAQLKPAAVKWTPCSSGYDNNFVRRLNGTDRKMAARNVGCVALLVSLLLATTSANLQPNPAPVSRQPLEGIRKERHLLRDRQRSGTQGSDRVTAAPSRPTQRIPAQKAINHRLLLRLLLAAAK